MVVRIAKIRTADLANGDSSADGEGRVLGLFISLLAFLTLELRLVWRVNVGDRKQQTDPADIKKKSSGREICRKQREGS